MDEQKIRDQLKKLESKTESWSDRLYLRLAASKWTGRITIAVIIVLFVLAVVL